MHQVKNKSINQMPVYLALGSNQAEDTKDSVELIKSSYELLADRGVNITTFSPFYQTPAFPAGNGPNYVNSVIEVKTNLQPEALLSVLLGIEQQLGRERVERWGARTIDIDLLDYAGRVLPSLERYNQWREMPLELQKTTWPDRLILPHPRIQDRGFVLVPLRSIAADWVHPVSLETIDALITEIDEEDLEKIVEI